MFYEHKIKCLACQLHFIVASYKRDWPIQDAAVIYCPECGNIGEKLVFAPVPNEGEIYELIPGTAGLNAGTPVMS